MSMFVKSKMLLKTSDFLSILEIKELNSILRDAIDISSNDEVTIICFNDVNSYRNDYQLLKKLIIKLNFYHIVEVDEENEIKNLYEFLNDNDESLFYTYNIDCQINITVNANQDLTYKWKRDKLI